jgi:hypothetical protein
MVLGFGVSRCSRGWGIKETLSQSEKLFRPHDLLSGLDVRQAGSYLVVTHISLVLAFYQLTMQLGWDDPGLCKLLTESRNHASMPRKGEPYAEQKCFSYVKHNPSCSLQSS